MYSPFEDFPWNKIKYELINIVKVYFKMSWKQLKTKNVDLFYNKLTLFGHEWHIFDNEICQLVIHFVVFTI